MARKSQHLLSWFIIYVLDFMALFLWRAARFLHIIFTLFKHLSRKHKYLNMKSDRKWSKWGKQKRTPGQQSASNRRSHNLSVHFVRPLGMHVPRPKLSFCLFAISAFLSGSQMLLFSVARSSVLWASKSLSCWLGVLWDLLWWWDPRPTKWSSLYACRCWDLLEGAFTASTKVKVLKIHCVMR